MKEAAPEGDTPPSALSIVLGIAIALVAFAAATALAFNDARAPINMSVGLDVFARLLGGVVAIAAVAYLAELRRAETKEEALLTGWIAMVVFLGGATLLTLGSWGPPAAMGLAFLAAAIAACRRGARAPEPAPPVPPPAQV